MRMFSQCLSLFLISLSDTGLSLEEHRSGFGGMRNFAPRRPLTTNLRFCECDCKRLRRGCVKRMKGLQPLHVCGLARSSRPGKLAREAKLDTTTDSVLQQLSDSRLFAGVSTRMLGCSVDGIALSCHMQYDSSSASYGWSFLRYVNLAYRFTAAHVFEFWGENCIKGLAYFSRHLSLLCTYHCSCPRAKKVLRSHSSSFRSEAHNV